MPFMPQPQQRQSPMRIVQEIMMLRMQQNQRAQERQIQHDEAAKERKENFKHQKALLEYQNILKGKQTPAEKALYDLKVKRLTAQTNAADALASQRQKIIDITADEEARKQEIYTRHKAGLATPGELKGVGMYVEPPKGFSPEAVVKGRGLNQLLETGGKGMSPELLKGIGAYVEPPETAKTTYPDIKVEHIRGNLTAEESRRLIELEESGAANLSPEKKEYQELRNLQIKKSLSKADQEMITKFNEQTGDAFDRIIRKIMGKPEPYNPYKFPQGGTYNPQSLKDEFQPKKSWRIGPNS